MKRCELKSEKKLCASCRERRALFCYRGVVKADKRHVLCLKCHRARLDHLRAFLAFELAQTTLQPNDWLW
jgi:hypothetical protein